MDTNQQGNIGEAKALQYFIESGYEVYLPFGTASKCDMVVVKSGKSERVSVKTSSFKKKGRYRVKIRQGKLNKEEAFNPESSDLLFIYIVPEDKVIVLSSKEVTVKFEMTINVD